MATPHISVFKYPLGFIRVIELLFIIIAIAAVNSWSFEMKYDCLKTDNTTIPKEAKVTTFTLSNAQIPSCKNDSNAPLWTNDNNAGGSAGFFYFVNVTALILVLITTFAYVMFWDLYQENKRFALADLGATALFFIFFFFCASIWWAGANTIGHSTSHEEVSRLLKENPSFWNKDEELSLNTDTTNGKLTISVLCNWVCVISFAFNCWCIWKEIVPREQEDPRTIG